MSTQRIGVERCMMLSPHGAGAFVRGSAYIDAKLAQGWTIVPSDRNHLTPERVLAEVACEGEKGAAMRVEQDSKEVKATDPGLSKPKRPRIAR